MSPVRKRVAVLISGRGSNLQALIDAAGQEGFPAEVALVVSDRPDVQGLQRAERAGVERRVLVPKELGGRVAFEAALNEALGEAAIDLICLAGFMRIFTAEFVARWEGRMINIHPSLLPAFPGLDSHQQALDAGVKLHGCSVHFVDVGVDSGPIIGQAAVPILPDDNADSLADRVLTQEHRLYPRCLELICFGDVQLRDGKAMLASSAAAKGAVLANPGAR